MANTAHMLTHIRNGQAVNKETVKVAYSNFNYELGKALEESGYISGVAKKGKSPKRYIEVKLKYVHGKGAINQITLVSKPGNRVYIKSQQIRSYKGGAGVGIISTSKGLKTDKEARKMSLGGEFVCKVW